MAGEDRGPDPAVSARLLREGFRFSFFQAVRLLQVSRPDAALVGRQGPVDREILRFRPELGLGFPASDVAGIREAPSPSELPRYEIATTFMGLYGPSSPLPSYFTEELIHAEQDDECLQREFLDIFHHRAISLFYRAWEKYRYSVGFRNDGSDPESRRLLALLGGAALPADHHVPAVRLLGFAGLLTQVPRSAASLRGLLAGYFEGVPVRVEPFAGRWVEIPEDQRCRLGVSGTTLGLDTSLGDRVYDLAATFRVELGPLGREDFMAFLPSGDRMPELRELVDLVNGDGLDYEIELILRDAEVPALQLCGPTARLGWCSWLGRRDGMDARFKILVKGWQHGRREPQGAGRTA